MSGFSPKALFQSKESVGYVVCDVALAVLAATGVALAICSIISYLPPEAGYCGGALCITSIISIAILSTCKGSRPEEHRAINAPDVQGGFLPKISTDNRTENGPSRTAETISAPPPIALCLPDDLYICIFEYLDARSVSALLRVCTKWAQVASIDSLWQKFFIQERFCNYGNTPPSSYYYKEAYQNSKIFKRRVLQWASPEQRMHIPKPTESPGMLSAGRFLIAEDRCFILHPGEPKNQFEIWDLRLKNRLFWKSIPSIQEVCLRLIGKVVYIIGWKGMSGYYRRDVFVFPFNAETNDFMPTLEFSQVHRTNSKTKTQFAINGKNAFTSQEDGGIRVWDLELEGKPDTEGSIPVCDSGYTRTFTFPVTRYQETPDTDQAYEKKVLRGHNKAVTAFKIFDNSLFSSASDGTIKQWDLSTYQCIQTIETGLVSAITFFQLTDRYIFGVTQDGSKVCQWDLVTKDLLFTADLKFCDAFFPVYNFLFCSHREPAETRLTTIYDLSEGKPIKTKTVDLLSGSFEFPENHMQFFDNRLYILGRFVSENRFESHLITWDFSRCYDAPLITPEQNPHQESHFFDACRIT